MAKKQTKKNKAKKPVAKTRAQKRTPKARGAVSRRATPRMATKKKASSPGAPAKQAETSGRNDRTARRAVQTPGTHPNAAARAPRREVPVHAAPDPLLHSQVDRPVTPITASPETEHAAVSNVTTVPFGTVQTQ